MSPAQKKSGGVPEAVRRAVEKTVQSTLGTAGASRNRAQELADEVLRRAEQSAARAGRGVREAGSKQREAASGVGDRVREAIQELKTFGGGEEIRKLRADVAALRGRVERLERAATQDPQRQTGARKSTASSS